MAKRPRKRDPEIDAIIGANLRRFRARLGWSQTELGEKLGVRFQQIQKYENATNRIAASTLYRLSKLLNVQVSDFFAGLDAGKAKAVPLLSREEADMLRLYTQISSDDFRRSIRKMMKSLCSDQTDVPESVPDDRQTA